jgi:HK97 family phage prohead protease
MNTLTPTAMQHKYGPAVDRLQCGLVELKFDSTNEKEMLFEGYGAVFGNVDSYGDVIQKGAFKESIREAKATGQWPAMLLQHGGWQMSADDLTPVGLWTDMEEDDTGLYLKGKLADDAAARHQRPEHRLRAHQVEDAQQRGRAAPHARAGEADRDLARHLPGQRQSTHPVCQRRARPPTR